MGVMESLRRGTENTTVRVVLVVVVVFFVFYMGRGAVQNPGQVLAEVGGSRITNTLLQRQMRVASRNFQGTLSEEQVKVLQGQVFDNLIETEVMVQEAKRLGIEISGEEIARQILRIDVFKDSKGKFSQDLYQSSLRRMGFTEGRYEEELRRELAVMKLQEMVAAGAHVSSSDVEREFLGRGTLVDVSYVLIPEAAMLSSVPVDDAAIDAKLAAEEPTLLAQYNQDKDRVWSTPRKAQVAGILLRSDLGASPEVVRKVAERVQKLASETDAAGFAALAAVWSEDLTAETGGNMGLMADSQMDPQLARGVFAAPVGSVGDIVETGRGLWVLRVEKVEESVVTSFDDAKRQIARTLLEREKVGKVAQDFAEQLLAGWKASGAAPVDLLAAHDLSAISTGALPMAGFQVPALVGADGLITAVRNARGAGVLDGVYPVEGGWAVAAITMYTAPDLAQLEAQRGMLSARLLAMNQNALVEAWRADLVAHAAVVRHWSP